MKINEVLLGEIGYAASTGNLQVPDEKLISLSKLVGHWDGREIFSCLVGQERIYFFKENNKITAFIVVKGSNLRGINNITKLGGQITSLVLFVTNKLKRALKISADEPMTSDGFKWITSLISAGGRGLKITDNNKQPVDLSLLTKEWENAKSSTLPGQQSIFGPTEIMIENNLTLNSIKLGLREHKEERLMPVYRWLGDKDVL